MSNPRGQAALDFEEAYTRAFVRKVIALVLGTERETSLLSYDEVRRKMGCEESSYGGLRTVPVSAIVGSVGRFKDFDRQFLPQSRAIKERWRRVAEAYYQDVVLPPVQLYQVGDVYFVKDGNHRVSVAKEKGMIYIDAEVIETRCKVPVSGAIEAKDLEELGERALFLEWSRLDDLRPDHGIRFRVPGAYRDLEEHIKVHRYYLGRQRQAEVPLWEAVASWYDDLYLPVVGLVREHGLLDRLPGHTDSDVYLWVMEHLHELRERYGDEVDASAAVADFAAGEGRRSLLGRVFDAVQRLLPSSPRTKGDRAS